MSPALDPSDFPEGDADAEYLIRQAMYAVEAAGASRALTWAVMFLDKAREAYVLHRESRPMTPDEERLIEESWQRLSASVKASASAR